MSTGFPEARIDPPKDRPADTDDRRKIAIAAEKCIEEMATAKGAEWTGRKGHSITADLQDLIDDYYAFAATEADHG